MDLKDIEFRTNAQLAPSDVRHLFSAVGWKDESRVPDANLHQAFNRDTVTATAWQGDELVGFVRGKIDGMYVYLTNLVVHPSSQGKGIGPELFRMVVHQAQEVPGIFAIVGLGSAGQESFYSRFGLHVPPAVVTISDKVNL